MTKREIRKLFRQKRSVLTSDEKLELNSGIFQQFKRITFPYNLKIVHSFISSERLVEPETSALLEYLKSHFPGIKIAVPKVDWKNQRMENLLLQEGDQMKQNNYGIDEPVTGTIINPEEIDLIIVPLLAFDRQGFRVGYGKGFYDRFFEECRDDVMRVGISFFDPVEDIEDRDKFDIRMTHCCTSGRLYIWQ